MLPGEPKCSALCSGKSARVGIASPATFQSGGHSLALSCTPGPSFWSHRAALMALWPGPAAPLLLALARAAIVYRMRKNALRQCDDAASAFAKCTEARLFSAAWACRDLLNALNECTKH